MSQHIYEKYFGQRTDVNFVSVLDFIYYDVSVIFLHNYDKRVGEVDPNELGLPSYVNTESICMVGKSNHFWAKHNSMSNIAVLLYDLGDTASDAEKFSEKNFLCKISGLVELINARTLKKVIVDFTDIFHKLFVFSKSTVLDAANSASLYELENFVQNLTMTIYLTNYDFDLYKKEKKSLLDKIDFYIDWCNPEMLKKINYYCDESQTVSLSTVLSRNLSNERSDVATPQFFENLAKYMQESHKAPLLFYNPPVNPGAKFEVEVFSGEKLRELGLNLFYAVGQAAVNPPKLVCLKYFGDHQSVSNGEDGVNKRKVIALVGKGVTYDTGGLNLKPTNSIENMHLDKSGACSVIATMKAISDLNLRVNVVGILGLAENAIGSKAYKPFSIIQSLSGKTVRVANTDAEGRLVLADCMTWVQQKFSPTEIIDLATLTGSCVSALGENYCGVFGNNDELIEDILRVGKQKYERGHRLPLDQEHKDELKCPDADLNSMGGKCAGASTAAAFLSMFVDTKWVHLDIAGPAMRSKRAHWYCENGTGFGVQLLYYYIKSLASE